MDILTYVVLGVFIEIPVLAFLNLAIMVIGSIFHDVFDV
jgi:hypothetical protein